MTAEAMAARGTMTRRAACLLAVVLAAGVAGCRTTTDEPVAAAWRGPFRKTLALTGKVAAEKTMTLQAATQGKLNFVVTEGTLVKAGETVFSLETKEIEERLASARIDQAVAAAGVAKAAEEIRSARIKRELSLRETTAQLEHARLELDRAERDLERKRRQVENKILPAAEIPQAELATEQARLSAENAGIALERLTEESSTREETLDLDRQAAEARLDKARAQVQEAEQFLERAVAVAPRDGVAIHARSWRAQDWKAGDEVWERQSIIELPDLSVMQIELEIHEADVADVRVGVPATVAFEAWPGLELAGSLKDVSGVAKELRDREGKGTGVRAFEAKVALAAQDARLRPGMTARVELLLDERADALQVPVSSVRRAAGRAFVTLASGEERAVVLAATSADAAVIESGLEEGDRVRLRPASGPAPSPQPGDDPAPPYTEEPGRRRSESPRG